MCKYVFVVVIFICFTAKISLAQNATVILYDNIIFSNNSIKRIDDSNFRAFQGQYTQKAFIVVAYIKANWFKAQQICGYQGLSLASIRSQEESDVVNSYLTRAGVNGNYETFWLSGTKIGDGKQWIWFNTGRPIVNGNWAPGEPNNAGGNENCASLRSNGLWNDAPCRTELFFICETHCPLTSYDLPIY